MEINRFEEVMGVVVVANTVEGKMGLLCENSVAAYDFGSRSDLPGFKVPATVDEAKKAKFIVTFAVDNRETPLFSAMPSYAYSMRRGGWDQAANVPFSTTVYLTHPGNQEGLTIPSGVPALAFGRGTYTVPSGAYIYSASIVPGSSLIVANTAEDTTDAGKLKYQSTFDDRTVAICEYKDSTTGALTFRLIE